MKLYESYNFSPSKKEDEGESSLPKLEGMNRLRWKPSMRDDCGKEEFKELLKEMVKTESNKLSTDAYYCT